MDFLIEHFFNRQFWVMLFTGLAAIATVLTFAMPLLAGDNLEKRMKTVALEREKIRARERERLARSDRASLRQEPKAFMKTVVEQFDLVKYLSTKDTKNKLIMAGLRGQGPMVVFLFATMASPILIFLFSLFYIFVVVQPNWSFMMCVTVSMLMAYVGLKLPEIYLRNRMQKRQLSIKRAFPDAMDLLLICVEAGMSIESAFRKVSEEIGDQSIQLAEEFMLTTAEIAYLQDRRAAYENLGNRTGLDVVRGVCGALIQAEKYGTPIGQALRVLAQESRDMRMAEAEKKAAALPPKLTVPMVLFFLPVLFVIIMGPAVMQVMKMS